MSSLLFLSKTKRSLNEAMGIVFKGLLVQCSHHGFFRTSPTDTFYISFGIQTIQDDLDYAVRWIISLDQDASRRFSDFERQVKSFVTQTCRANDSDVRTDAPLSNSSSSNNFCRIFANK
ncbi:hypothetical protein Tco_0752789 [Tanacetum coccineum]|uniref:Uncharacterized protein n=1 Tax=Tanacetum coccineum TaxID=301880 RepID=A0ABQ4Z7U6_9ASTR